MLADSLVLQPPTDALRIALTGALLAALGAVVYVRASGLSRRARRLLGGLRVLALAGMTFVLLGPSMLRWLRAPVHRRTLLVAIDTSCSFGVPDVNGRSRFEAARDAWLRPDFIQELRSGYDLRIYRYDERLNTASLGKLWELTEPEGRQTYIAAAIGRLLEGELVSGAAPAGLVLIGDGHETGSGDLREVGEMAGRHGVRIWTSCLGGQRDTHDVAVQTFSGEEMLFAKQTGRLAAKVVQTGFGTSAAKVELLRDGQHVADRVVDFRNRVASDVTFDVREDEPGLFEYTIRVDPLPGETEPGNNERVVFVRVSNERIRTLLVEGRPYWDTKYLAQTLRSDPQIELTQIVRYGPSRLAAIRSGTNDAPDSAAKVDTTVPLPQTQEELYAYDVIIIGKDVMDVLGPNRLPWLKGFVSERGGGLVFARGRAYDPSTPAGAAAAQILAPLEPASWGEDYIRNLQLSLTPTGMGHPSFQFNGDRPPDVLVHELPGMIGAIRVRKEKAAALVLALASQNGRPADPPQPLQGQQKPAEPPPMAAIAYQTYGKGKVVSILSEGLWRWSMLPTRYDDFIQSSPYDLLWRRMARWLAGQAEFLPGQEATLAVAAHAQNLGDTVRVEVRLRRPPKGDIQMSLRVAEPDGTESPLVLTKARDDGTLLWAAFEPKQQGVYRLTLDTPSLTPPTQETRFSVYDYSSEMIQTSADPAAFRELAEASGGRVIEPSDARSLLADLKAANPAPQPYRQLDFVWDSPWVFAVLAGLLAIEWWSRRRLGVA